MNIEPTSFFGALSNETRLRCLVLLWAQGELCVCELTHALGLPQPNVSRNLAHLRELGIVSDRRAGVWVHYRISETLPGWCRDVIERIAQSLSSAPPFAADSELLREMPDRPSAPRCES